MKSFKKLIESNKQNNINSLFPNKVMTAHVANNRNDLKMLSIPKGDRSNKQKLNIKVNFNDYKDDDIVVLQSHDGNIYYWIIKDSGWELLNDRGHEISSIPYKAVDLNAIYKKIKK